MRWVVIGAGAIGGGLGGALFRAGERVHFVARGFRGQALAQHGLRWRTPDRDETLPIPTSTADELVPGPDDVLCLATKLHDAPDALDSLPAAFAHTPVVTWTNGVQAPAWAAETGRDVVAAAVVVPATIDDPATATLWGVPHYGAMHLGVTHGDGTTVRDAMHRALGQAGFDPVSHDDVWPILRAKWMTNLMGAAQALVRPEGFEAVALAALAEGIAVLEHAGVPCADVDALSPRPITVGTIDGTTRDGGSTFRSITRGKPLETPYLNGPLVDLARAHGTAAPINEALLRWADVAMDEGWRAPRIGADDVLAPSSVDRGT